MGTPSALLTIVDALNAQIVADTAITGLCTVFDGPPLIDRSAAVELWIGATGIDQAEDAITLSRTISGFGGGPSGALRREVVSVPCALWAIGGETTTSERRAQIRLAFDAVCANVSAGSGDLGLGAVLCGGVEVAEGSLRQMQTPDGFGVVLQFTIRVDAQI